MPDGKIDTIDEPPREPKLNSAEMITADEVTKLVSQADQESIISSGEEKGSQLGERRSQLDSQKSYTDIVNTSENRGAGGKEKRSSQDAQSANDTPQNIQPISTVISNVRGRSIISGGKDLIVSVNGSYEPVRGESSRHSTGRISNKDQQRKN